MSLELQPSPFMPLFHHWLTVYPSCASANLKQTYENLLLISNLLPGMQVKDNTRSCGKCPKWFSQQ